MAFQSKSKLMRSPSRLTAPLAIPASQQVQELARLDDSANLGVGEPVFSGTSQAVSKAALGCTTDREETIQDPTQKVSVTPEVPANGEHEEEEGLEQFVETCSCKCCRTSEVRIREMEVKYTVQLEMLRHEILEALNARKEDRTNSQGDLVAPQKQSLLSEVSQSSEIFPSDPWEDADQYFETVVLNEGLEVRNNRTRKKPTNKTPSKSGSSPSVRSSPTQETVASLPVQGFITSIEEVQRNNSGEKPNDTPSRSSSESVESVKSQSRSYFGTHRKLTTITKPDGISWSKWRVEREKRADRRNNVVIRGKLAKKLKKKRRSSNYSLSLS